MKENQLRVSIISTLDGLNQLEKEWSILDNSTDSNFITNTYKYLHVFYNSFYQKPFDEKVIKNEMYIAVLYRDENIIAILPSILVTRKRLKLLKVRSLEFIGQQYFSCYSDIISNNLSHNEYKFLIDELLKKTKIDIIYLSHLSESSKILSIDPSNAFCFNLVHHFDINRFNNYEEYLRLYSKSHKQNLRTAKNRIKKDGYIINEKTKPFEYSDIQEIIRISNSKLRDSKESFYKIEIKKEIALSLYFTFTTEISYLTLNDKNVAYRINIIENNSKFCFDASYDRDYRKYSVGILSVEFNIIDSFKKKLNFHFEGWGDDHYKNLFSTNSDKLYTKLIKGNTLLKNFWFRNYTKKAISSVK